MAHTRKPDAPPVDDHSQRGVSIDAAGVIAGDAKAPGLPAEIQLAPSLRLVSIEHVAQIAKMSTGWLRRRLREAGAVLIGDHVLADDLIALFRAKANGRLDRLAGGRRVSARPARPRPSLLPSAKALTAGSAKAFVNTLIDQEP